MKYGDIGLDALAKSGFVEPGFSWIRSHPRAITLIWIGFIRCRSRPNMWQGKWNSDFSSVGESVGLCQGAQKIWLLLARAGAGYDKIDFAACTENDVVSV